MTIRTFIRRIFLIVLLFFYFLKQNLHCIILKDSNKKNFDIIEYDHNVVIIVHDMLSFSIRCLRLHRLNVVCWSFPICHFFRLNIDRRLIVILLNDNRCRLKYRVYLEFCWNKWREKWPTILYPIGVRVDNANNEWKAFESINDDCCCRCLIDYGFIGSHFGILLSIQLYLMNEYSENINNQIVNINISSKIDLYHLWKKYRWMCKCVWLNKRIRRLYCRSNDKMGIMIRLLYICKLKSTDSLSNPFTFHLIYKFTS